MLQVINNKYFNSHENPISKIMPSIKIIAWEIDRRSMSHLNYIAKRTCNRM